MLLHMEVKILDTFLVFDGEVIRNRKICFLKMIIIFLQFFHKVFTWHSSDYVQPNQVTLIKLKNLINKENINI